MFAYGWLILLQLPLHLLVLILNGKTTGLSPLALTTYGLVLHSWLLNEIQLNEFTLVKLDKIYNPTKNNFLTNPNILIYTMLFFFVKYLWMFNISSPSVAS